ncbi:MAG: hypothetical protein M0P13_09280 [Fibrobacteraceae bacterium]|nr:hypothetical protein [Fibrobacteraceae bacterium]
MLFLMLTFTACNDSGTSVLDLSSDSAVFSSSIQGFSSSGALSSSEQKSSSSKEVASLSSSAVAAVICPALIDSSTENFFAAWNACDSLFKQNEELLYRVDISTGGFVSNSVRYWFSAGIVDSSMTLYSCIDITTGGFCPPDTSARDNPVEALFNIRTGFCTDSTDFSSQSCIQRITARFDTITGLPLSVYPSYYVPPYYDVDAISSWVLDSAVWFIDVKDSTADSLKTIQTSPGIVKLFP